jgi:large subunit ribosomal protein L28
LFVGRIAAADVFHPDRPQTSDLGWVGVSAPAHGRGGIVAGVCQVTGAGPGFGNSISHSHRRNRRRFDVNIQKKTYYVPSLKRSVKLTVSAKGIKVIDARGIESVVGELLARGEKI